MVRARLGRVAPERQQQKLKVDRFAVGALRRHAGDGADALVVEDGKEIGDDRLARRGPQADERLAFELAAEQRADPRAGEPKRMTRAAVERQDEGVAEHLANGAGLDLGALGRRTLAAPLLPIRIEFPARCVFHGRTAPCHRAAAAHLSLIGTGFAANGCLMRVRSRGRADARVSGSERRRANA